MAKANGADQKKVEQKKADQKKPKKKKVEEGDSGKLLYGVLACIVVIEVIILFLTLELSTGKLDSYYTTTLWQAIFIVPLHLPTFFTNGMWSILAALMTGAFIGGLIVKKIKKGILVGIISFIILLLLQFGIGFYFYVDYITPWYSIISSAGGNVFIDYLVSIGILSVSGAIGGAMTRE